MFIIKMQTKKSLPQENTKFMHMKWYLAAFLTIVISMLTFERYPYIYIIQQQQQKL